MDFLDNISYADNNDFFRIETSPLLARGGNGNVNNDNHTTTTTTTTTGQIVPTLYNAPNTLSPFQRRINEFCAAQEAAGPNASIFRLFSEENLLISAGLLDQEYPMDDQEQKATLHSLTEDQVSRDVHAMIVSSATISRTNSKFLSLLCADTNASTVGVNEGFIVLKPTSSLFIIDEISRQLAVVAREVNKIERLIKSTPGEPEVPGAAQYALELTVSTTMAIHGLDHWRWNVHDVSLVQRLIKRVLKVNRLLLWFTDAELGWQDSFSRRGWVYHLRNIATDWLETSHACNYTIPTMKFSTHKNNHTKGRTIVPRSIASEQTEGS